MLASVLAPHNEAEERAGGLYATCDEVLSSCVDGVLAELLAFPPVPLAQHQDGPLVRTHIEDAIERARTAWTLYTK